MNLYSTAEFQLLLERFQPGDRAMIARLLERAQPRLEKLARKILRGDRVHRWEQTGDLQQRASLRLVRRLQTEHPHTPAEFFRMAAQEMSRELIDLARHYFGPAGEGVHHDSAPEAVALSPDERTSAWETAWLRVYELFPHIPEPFGESFRAKYLLDLTYTEIAELRGLHPQTVKTHYRQALEWLHEQFGGELPA
jgi:RNA polymerase sigma-70 factor (ECF subfamily)